MTTNRTFFAVTLLVVGAGAASRHSGASALAQTPTYSLKAVAFDPICIGGTNAGRRCSTEADCGGGRCRGGIEPTNKVFVQPGDIVECAVFASNWSPNGQHLAAWQVKIDVDGFTSGGGGRLTILDEPRRCRGDDDCGDLQVGCDSNGFCEMPPVNPEGVFIASSRDDYIYAGLAAFPALSRETGAWGAFAISGAPAYSAPPKYAGSLRLVVSDDACGTFTVSPRPSPASNFAGTDNILIEPVFMEPLSLDAGTCPDQRRVEPDPPNCSIDARQPTDPDGGALQGPSHIDLRFAFDDIVFAEMYHFSIRERPPGDTPINIDGLEVDPDGRGIEWVRVFFDRPISTDRWTCVKVLPKSQEICIAHLPGDSDQDGLVQPIDPLQVIACMTTPGLTCAPYECDIDRSGTCTSADLLRAIDLLGGGAVYEPWLGRSLPVCPTAP